MIHVLHIRKTGGSALFDALSPSAVSRSLVLHPHATRLIDLPLGETVIFSVRDPLTRFCSGFNSRLRCGRPRNDIPWRPEELEAFSRFRTPDALAHALGSSDSGARDAAERAMTAIPHLAPLKYWLGSIDEIHRRADDLIVLTQANLTEDFERLKRLLAIDDAHLPQDEVRAHRTPAGFDTHLSANSIANLRARYAEDEMLYRECVSRRISAPR